MIDVAMASAPPSVGNMAVGFDILGHALDCAGDRVKAIKQSGLGVEIGEISGVVDTLPRNPADNTAGAAALKLLEHSNTKFGVRLDLHKQIALGSGMGGSASSAVASVLAVNQLLDEPLSKAQLIPFALAGEQVASGTTHGDNVAPSLLGGMVFIPLHNPAHFVSIPVPTDLHAVLVRPHIRLDTATGRSILKPQVELKDAIVQSSRLATLICACFNDDIAKLRGVLDDVLVEPQRSHQVKGFESIQSAALEAGALGCTLSGSGPSVVAWCHHDDQPAVTSTMVETAGRFHQDFQYLNSPVNAPGASLISASEWASKE